VKRGLKRRRNAPRTEAGQGEQNPHRRRTQAAFLAVAVDPGCYLWQKHDRREREVDDEQQVPRDTLLRDGSPDARAEGSHRVENDVASNADGVDESEHPEFRAFEVEATRDPAREPR